MLVYKLRGDSINVVPNWFPGTEQVDKDFFYAERRNHDQDCRLTAAAAWKEIRLIPFLYNETNAIAVANLPGAINISYLLHGVRTIISDRAKQLIEPFIKNECVFLPMVLDPSPERYWVMYVTKILDCLDPKSSKFGRMIPRSIHRYSFLEDRLKGNYLFRLPGYYEYLDSHDFATQSFLDLTLSLDIHGFEFWECNKPGQDPIVT